MLALECHEVLMDIEAEDVALADGLFCIGEIVDVVGEFWLGDGEVEGIFGFRAERHDLRDRPEE